MKLNYLRLLILSLFVAASSLIFAFSSNSTTSPSRLFILWTAENVAVPIGYTGRPLPSPGSTLQLSALLLPLSAQTSDLEYRWFVDQKLLRRGVNLKSISFVPTLVGNRTIEVEIRKGQAIVAKKSVSVPIINPQLVIFLEGFGQVQGGIAVPWHEELMFHARPYFFPLRQEEKIAYQWSIDGIAVAGEEGRQDKLMLELSRGDLRPLKIGLEAQNTGRAEIRASEVVIINLQGNQ